MTSAKEKAYELVNKFQSKQHALTCVVVIKELIKEEQPVKYQQELINWWDKVILQIESIT